MVTAIAERSASGDERGATSGSAQGGWAANDDRRGIATGCREKLRLKRADGSGLSIPQGRVRVASHPNGTSIRRHRRQLRRKG